MAKRKTSKTLKRWVPTDEDGVAIDLQESQEKAVEHVRQRRKAAHAHDPAHAHPSSQNPKTVARIMNSDDASGFKGIVLVLLTMLHPLVSTTIFSMWACDEIVGFER